MSFYKEPIINCEKCGEQCRADWVDIGFGPYSQQGGPFHCHSCGWTEGGCPQIECVKERCLSWEYCQGEAIL